MKRLFRLAALVGALLFSQFAFAFHGVEHLANLDHEVGEVCVHCLALTGAVPVPTAAMSTVIRLDAAPERPLYGVSPRLTLSSCIHFLARAPPAVL